MTLHEELEQVKAELAGAKTTADNMQAAQAAYVTEIEGLKAQAAHATEQMTAKDAEIKAKEAVIGEGLAKIESLTASLAEAKTKLADPSYAAALEVGSKSAVPEGAQAVTGPTKDEVKAEYAKLRDPVERAQFRVKYRSMLVG